MNSYVLVFTIFMLASINFPYIVRFILLSDPYVTAKPNKMFFSVSFFGFSLLHDPQISAN